MSLRDQGQARQCGDEFVLLNGKTAVAQGLNSQQLSYSAKAEYPVRCGLAIDHRLLGILDHPPSRVMTSETSYLM